MPELRVCLDASFVVAWLLPEEFTARAFALREEWEGKSAELIAPPLLPMETGSVLRQAIHRGRVSAEEGEEAFRQFRQMRIRITEPQALLDRAWELGRTLNAPRLYDMFYLALANIEQCELWTGDKRLFNASRGQYSAVNYLGDYARAP
ncbi:MAG: type II toxin-antitoxin system VapC family toxin [Dehalococcoidia bacterium]|nr:type II toxin-antitoxin system VapC family toxin [Dehalococcoidia bacterium]